MRRSRLVAMIGLAGFLVVLAPGVPAFATFPGQHNGRIAYLVKAGANPWGYIWSVNPDGSAPKQLTLGGRELEPKWSPNGAEIAYVGHLPKPNRELTAIWTMNADGSGNTQITSSGIQPTWSPDGKWIAYINGGVWKIRSTAPYGKPIQVTFPQKLSNSNTFVGDGQPAWSNDGTTIAFDRYTSYSSGTQSEGELDTVNVTSLKVTRFITGPCGAFDGYNSPNYGPGGRYLLYTYSNGGCLKPPSGIYSIAVTGGSAKLIADGDSAAWSPVGGSQIVYDVLTNGSTPPTAIWIANVNGTGAHKIVSPGVEPDWQPLA